MPPRGLRNRAALAVALAAACAPLAAGALSTQPADEPAAGAAAGSSAAAGQYVWILNQTDCRPGLWRQPGGPFAALVFCEHGLGAYLALAYLAPLPASSGKLGAWSVTDLTWQEHPWATDVTSFAWTPDGRRLLVATADGAGAGALYDVDLRARAARQVAPADSEVTSERPGPGYVIERLDLERQILHYRVLPWNLPPGAAEAESLSLAQAPALAPVPRAAPASDATPAPASDATPAPGATAPPAPKAKPASRPEAR